MTDPTLRTDSFPSITDVDVSRMSAQISIYNDEITRLSSTNDATTVDFFNTTIFEDWTTLSDDGNHPNGAGYDAIATIWYQKITGSPTPTTPTVIKANSQGGSITVSSGTPVSITISLEPDNLSGQDADWWVVELAPSGAINYFDLSTVSMVPGLLPTYQGPLFGFGNAQLLNSSDLSAGTHIFCFGVDLNMDGSLNTDSLYYDCVTVSVTE